MVWVACELGLRINIGFQTCRLVIKKFPEIHSVLEEDADSEDSTPQDSLNGACQFTKPEPSPFSSSKAMFDNEEVSYRRNFVSDFSYVVSVVRVRTACPLVQCLCLCRSWTPCPLPLSSSLHSRTTYMCGESNSELNSAHALEVVKCFVFDILFIGQIHGNFAWHFSW